MRLCGTTKSPEGQIIPVISMNCFINTLEGNNLYAECSRKRDMYPYREAKARWEMEHTDELSIEAEYPVTGLQSWTPDMTPGLPYIEPLKVVEGQLSAEVKEENHNDVEGSKGRLCKRL